MKSKIFNVSVFSVIFVGLLKVSHGCSIEGVSNWLLPVTQSIHDTHRGTFFRRTTSNIAAINTVMYSEGLNGGPYINIIYNDSEFSITTNEQYTNYEELETIDLIGVTVVFRCTGGTLRTLVFSINIIDTNNNAPEFKPNDIYRFKIAPPVLPGFLITDCGNDIIVRDIDLTTHRIDFQIEENPYFEITYDTSTSPKEFKASLRVISFIRRISEPITLWISATDIDGTGDPPLTTNATVHIEADNEFEFPDDLIFSETYYLATYTEEHKVVLEKIIYLQQGYDENVTFHLEGDFLEYFDLIANGNNIILKAKSHIPSELLNQTAIYFVIRANREFTSGATSAIILKLQQDFKLRFDMAFYEGSIVDNSLKISNLMLQGDFVTSDISITIYSEFSDFFTANIERNIISLEMNPLDDSIIKNNNIIILQVAATINKSITTTIVVLEIVKEDYITPIFEKNIYNATYGPVVGVTMENILLIQGYDDTVTVFLTGEYANYFQVTQDGAVLNINSTGLPSQVINERHLLINVKVTKPRTVGAHTFVYIAMPIDTEVIFDKLHYKGSLRGSDVSHEIIALTGYEGTSIDIEGDHSDLFIAEINSGKITVHLKDSLTVPVNISHVVLELYVLGVGTVLVLDVYKSDSEDRPVAFDKLHYNGILREREVSHETILVSGYTGTNVIILGDYADVFMARLNSGQISVQLRDSALLIINTSYVALELHVADASAVLTLEIIKSESSVLPTVKFNSESYVIKVEIWQTGLVGKVIASTDNGEAVIYSLVLENVHLQERVSINEEGELYLSAPATSGIHIFEVVATSVITGVNGTATVILTVEEASTCSNDIVVPPLIVIDRDEEEPHENLVVLNTTTFPDCHYEMTNHWPVNQTWLYVDENGLHTRAIDREDQSIAFMTLSQIQVELNLHCKNDEQNTRTKHSLITNAKLNSLDPYDYGSSKWVLTDTILYNGRRSFVNLIVNDINDNDPVFILKPYEPIVVGYPVPELAEIILPKALVELKATDADIGENAALVYWSPEPVLAVSPSTGYVHVRKNAQLENDDLLKVYAIDRKGLGRNGSIDLMVRSLEINHIAVLTIQGAFLEDSNDILSEIGTALGYEVRTLNSVIIPDSTRQKVKPDNLHTEKNKRNQMKKKAEAGKNGALLQLYIYGLIAREPVEVNQLTSDIGNSIITVNVASLVSLEDHLESREICLIPERDTGLLAATIALSILLFILIVALALWFSLKWRMKQNYDKYSDENSMASRNHSLQPPKAEDIAKPTVNLEDLKKSQRTLQEFLDAPINNDEIDVLPQTEIPPSPELRMPIVIQSIDKLKDATETSEDEDEFGEKEKVARKSVVTFNENVEKIIHLVDNQTDPDYEVYEF